MSYADYFKRKGKLTYNNYTFEFTYRPLQEKSPLRRDGGQIVKEHRGPVKNLSR